MTKLVWKVFISSKQSAVLFSCSNTCLSNICSVNMCLFLFSEKSQFPIKNKVGKPASAPLPLNLEGRWASSGCPFSADRSDSVDDAHFVRRCAAAFAAFLCTSCASRGAFYDIGNEVSYIIKKGRFWWTRSTCIKISLDLTTIINTLLSEINCGISQKKLLFFLNLIHFYQIFL